MHTAPTVAYPVGRSGVHLRVFIALWTLAAAVTVAFAVAEGATLRTLLSVLVFLLAFALAWRGLRGTATGRITWDGVTWWWETAGAGRVEGLVVPCLDLQAVVLVHFSGGTGPGRWLWLERSMAPVFWGRLRCALMQVLPEARLPRSGVVPAGRSV